MTRCEWLEEHGFLKIKDYWNGNWNYRTYQKIDDFMPEYLVNCELFCKNKNGTHDSFTLK